MASHLTAVRESAQKRKEGKEQVSVRTQEMEAGDFGGEVTWGSSVEKNWRFLRKLNTELPHDSETLPLGVYPKEPNKRNYNKRQWTPTFTAALLANSQGVEATQIPTTDDWINNMWSIHTAEYYFALKRKAFLTPSITWMHVEETMLSEINPSHKFVIPVT